MKRRTVKQYIPKLMEKLSDLGECECHSASEFAIFTAKDKIPNKIKEDLTPLYGKYFK